jgi:hypothetical protein
MIDRPVPSIKSFHLFADWPGLNNPNGQESDYFLIMHGVLFCCLKILRIIGRVSIQGPVL